MFDMAVTVIYYQWSIADIKQRLWTVERKSQLSTYMLPLKGKMCVFIVYNVVPTETDGHY